jgi:hypothetical protein
MKDCRDSPVAAEFSREFDALRRYTFCARRRMAKPRNKHQDEGAAAPSAPQNVGDTTAAAPDRERIAMRAYELYLARGGSDGAAMDDWLTAEREFESGPESNRES